jgi:DNA-binding NarL/FixJ family response regulator
MTAPQAVQTLMLVDDNPEFLLSAGAMLAEEGFDVVARISDTREVVQEVQRLRPAVVLVDVHMPVVTGFQVARLLAELDEPPIVFLISSRDAASFGDELMDAPVRGFISKRELSGHALASIL